MSKYRVYLKEGKGVFDIEADCYDDPFYEANYIEFSRNETTVAIFERSLIYAVIDTGNARRLDANEPVYINMPNLTELCCSEKQATKEN